MKNKLYPLYFKPIYKSYIWGGNRIVTTFHRKGAPEKVAESWEISDRPDGMSIVENGPLQGKTLHELMGPSVFPLLIKILDANHPLSIQVHPDDIDAARLKAEPKTEMWYVLHAEKEGAVYAGLKTGIDKATFEKSVAEGSVVNTLQKIPVKAGDVISIPGGTVHAILAGCLLLEVQQNSNTTYRIYDWNRLDIDGKPRPLHIHEALQVIHYKNKGGKVAPQLIYQDPQLKIWELLKTPYFLMQKIEGPYQAKPGCQIFFPLKGKGTITANGHSQDLLLGRACLIPADCQDVEVRGEGIQFLRITF